MNNNISEDQQASANNLCEAIQPIIDFLAQRLQNPPDYMMDIGSGEGLVALWAAQYLKASKVVLVDNSKCPLVQLPHKAVFSTMDACSDSFLQTFRGQPTLLTCFRTIHEFNQPLQGALNLMNVLRRGGMAFILDFSENGWQQVESVINKKSLTSRCHFSEDIGRMRGSALRLDTDQGIRIFWENSVLSKLPGKHHLMFHETFYTVIYKAPS